MLSTSESTIRRDLNALDEIGKIRKVFGGATSVTQSVGMLEDNVSDREHLMYEEKTEIGKYAATLIRLHHGQQGDLCDERYLPCEKADSERA